jgi:aminoglycoside/choline kinase family phosphotransferase
MLADYLVQLTLQNLPEYQPGEEFVMSPIKKGGSGRKFYRICLKEGLSVILVQYTEERRENAYYVDIAKFLSGAGIRVPCIHFHEPDAGLILMQDLGPKDLWSYRQGSWEVRRPLYEAALSEIFLMHRNTMGEFSAPQVRMELEFNEQLYLWEQNYFFENCVKNVWGFEIQVLREIPALLEMAAQLASLPRMLIHRDFQSQNILIFSGNAWLIDFQGMRFGLGLYDVASLLYDPYVQLPEEERQVLLAFYEKLWRDAGSPLQEGFESIFLMCAVQRLMQALGAYGFLGLQKKRKSFLGHIRIARKLLREVAGKLEGLEPLVKMLDQAI